jgi:Cft2 family RNA processing exonuclease
MLLSVSAAMPYAAGAAHKEICAGWGLPSNLTLPVSKLCGVLWRAVIVEATYGVNRHEERTQRERRLVETVRGIVSRGGRVLMPVVALGRAQVLLVIRSSLRGSAQCDPGVLLSGAVIAM